MYALIPLLALSVSQPPPPPPTANCSITGVFVRSDLTAPTWAAYSSSCSISACQWIQIKVTVSDNTQSVAATAVCNLADQTPVLGNPQIDAYTWVFGFNVSCYDKWDVAIAVTCTSGNFTRSCTIQVNNGCFRTTYGLAATASETPVYDAPPRRRLLRRWR